MDNFIVCLKSQLDLCEFTLVKTNSNKLVIFKCFNKYTKCIYINVFDNHIEINVDKVFDFKGMSPGIERLLISKKVFYNIDETLDYIKKNIAI